MYPALITQNIIISNAGTFGQDSEWHLGDPSTYQYPSVLEDILYDKNDELLNMHSKPESSMSSKSHKELEDDKVKSDHLVNGTRHDDDAFSISLPGRKAKVSNF